MGRRNAGGGAYATLNGKKKGEKKKVGVGSAFGGDGKLVNGDFPGLKEPPRGEKE